MTIETRLKKLEQRIEQEQPKKIDLSHLTEEEIDFMIECLENNKTDNPDFVKLDRAIKWVSTELTLLTDEEIEKVIERAMVEAYE